MRPWHLLTVVFLGACATQDVAQISHRARFAEYPENLLESVESACSEPSDSFSRPDDRTIECRTFLNPQETAVAIMTYEGILDDLPRLVLQFHVEPDEPGYLVQFDSYLNVPQKTGAPLRVFYRNPTVTKTVNKIMRVAGGKPEPIPVPGNAAGKPAE